MPRNGSGVMEIEFPDFTPSTTILSSEVDQNNNDIADEITNSLPRDGQAGMNGQFKAADGTVSAPAISFTLDTNCGAYRIGADNIGFAIGGVKVLDLSASGLGFTGLSVSAEVAFTGDITPAQIGATQNDYAPTGHGTAFVFRVASDASRDITGLASGADGRVVRFRNVGTFDLVLKDENAGSAAENRFALSGDFTLLPDESADLQYDATLSRWTLAATSFNLTGIPTETAPATNDQILIRDTSAAAARRMRLDNALNVLNALTEETSVDILADFLLAYDTSAAAVRKVKPQNFVSGLVLISSFTVSTPVASIDFTSIPTFYSSLLISIDAISPSAGSPNLLMRFSTDNGANYTATGYAGIGFVTGNVTFSTSTTSAQISGAISAAVTRDVSVYILGYGQPSTQKTIRGHDTVAAVFPTSNVTGAIDALRILWASGNIDAGTVRLYGVR